MDVRPHILGDHQVKFKCQALPLRGQLGGIRLLFSHNVQFPRSNLNETDVLSMGTMTRIFPVLEHLRKDPNEKVKLVSDTIIEEVLQDIGTLDFGQGIRAKANIGLGAPAANTVRSSANCHFRSDSNTAENSTWRR